VATVPISATAELLFTNLLTLDETDEYSAR